VALAVAVLLAGCAAGPDDADPDDAGPAPTTPATSPAASPTPSATPVDLTPGVAAELTALETAFDARLGVYAVDTATGDVVAHRADERFGYASTIKALAAGAVLAGQPATELDAPLPVTAEDVSEAGYAPVTAERVGTDMTVGELGAAAVSESDNGALNVLLRHLGGPAALQAALVGIGDTTTQVDAGEPELNHFTPGETPRTSTPRALADGLATYALGDALLPDVRDAYVGWLTGSTTGAGTIRAGTPEGWVVGSKTGAAGRYGSRNDLAVVWPPDGAPVVLAVLTDRAAVDAEPDDALIAQAAAVVLGAYAAR
jgi:beta-lactamase class A